MGLFLNKAYHKKLEVHKFDEKFQNKCLMDTELTTFKCKTFDFVDFLQTENFRVLNSPHDIDTCDKLQEMFPFHDIFLTDKTDYGKNIIWVEFNPKRMVTYFIKDIEQKMNINKVLVMSLIKDIEQKMSINKVLVMSFIQNIEQKTSANKVLVMSLIKDIEKKINANEVLVLSLIQNSEQKTSANEVLIKALVQDIKTHEIQHMQIKFEMIKLKKIMQVYFFLILVIFIGIIYLLKFKELQNLSNTFENELIKFQIERIK